MIYNENRETIIPKKTMKGETVFRWVNIVFIGLKGKVTVLIIASGIPGLVVFLLGY